MTIWKLPLAQTVLDAYLLRQFFISHNESHIPIVHEEVGVKKKQYNFQNRRRRVSPSQHLMSWIKKLLFESLFEM
jgi:hypothetical protein